MNLNGWSLRNGTGAAVPLGPAADAGVAVRVDASSSSPALLSPGGGSLLLVSAFGAHVDRAHYSASDVARRGGAPLLVLNSTGLLS